MIGKTIRWKVDERFEPSVSGRIVDESAHSYLVQTGTKKYTEVNKNKKVEIIDG